MSAPRPPRYRRVVLDLPPHAPDRLVLRAAAELARLLDAELHAVLVEDAALTALAHLPFARELRMPTHEWQTVSGRDLAAEMRFALEKTRRDIAALREAMGLRGETETRQGDPASLIASICVDSDIVVLAAPGRMAAHALGDHARRRQAAHRSVASVALLPPAPRSDRGPIAVVVRDSDDPALTMAGAIAARAGEELLVLAPAELLRATRAKVREVVGAGGRIRGKELDGDIIHALRGTEVRLIVLTRGAVLADSEEALRALADATRALVLALEPETN